MSKKTRKLWKLIKKHHKQRLGIINAYNRRDVRRYKLPYPKYVILSQKVIMRELRRGDLRTDVAFYEGLRCSGYFELIKTAGGRITSTQFPHEP